MKLDGTSCISNVKQPILTKDVATKEYVDTLFESEPFSYGENVIRKLSNLPELNKPCDPGRYLIDTKTSGNTNPKDKEYDYELAKKDGWIAEWDGLEWTFQNPPNKHIVFLDSIKSRIMYVSELNQWITYSSTETFHSNLDNLLHDDHPQYTLLSGRPNGQIVAGGTNRDDSLTLLGSSFTSNDGILNLNIESAKYNRDYTKGRILLNPGENGGGVGVGCDLPDEALHVNGNVKVTGCLVDSSGLNYYLPSSETNATPDSEPHAHLVSENSMDTLRNKTLVSPVLSGYIHNFCYKVDSIMKSQDLAGHHILFIVAKDAITLTLPDALLYPGKEYVIRMLKKGGCHLIVSSNNRIDQNHKKYTISSDTKTTTIVSDGVSRWYTM